MSRLCLHTLWFGLPAIWLCAVQAPLAYGSNLPDPVAVYTEDTMRFMEMLKSGLPERRIQGIQGLSHHKYWPAEKKLLPLLEDTDVRVRREAVMALGRIGSARSVPALIDLLEDSCWELSQNSRLALGRMTAQRLDEPAQWKAWFEAASLEDKQRALFDALQKDRGAVSRAAVLRALSHLAGPELESDFLGYLESGLKPPLSADEQKFALETLERIGTAASIPFLSRQIRNESAWALGRIGGLEAEAALLGFPGTLPVLVNLDRLGSTNAGPFVPQLIQQFGLVTFRSQPDDLHEEPTPMQRVAANLIRRSGQAPLVVETVISELEATMPGGVIATTPPPHLASLMQRMREELKPGFVRNDGVTTSQPLTAMYHLAEDAALAPRLIPLLEHPAFVPRIYVAMLLGKLGDEEAIPAILRLVHESYSFPDATRLVSGKHFGDSQTVRWRGFLCMALGRLGSENARVALESLAADPRAYRDIRYGAVVGLGFIRSPQSLPVLSRVADEDIIWMVRHTAGQIVSRIELEQREVEAGQ